MQWITMKSSRRQYRQFHMITTGEGVGVFPIWISGHVDFLPPSFDSNSVFLTPPPPILGRLVIYDPYFLYSTMLSHFDLAPSTLLILDEYPPPPPPPDRPFITLNKTLNHVEWVDEENHSAKKRHKHKVKYLEIILICRLAFFENNFFDAAAMIIAITIWYSGH